MAKGDTSMRVVWLARHKMVLPRVQQNKIVSDKIKIESEKQNDLSQKKTKRSESKRSIVSKK